MTYPRLNITVITYRRPEMLTRVLESIAEHVIYPKSCLQIIVSFDELEPTSISSFHGQFHQLFQNRLGMGGNWNAAIAHSEAIGADYTLCCQDDWLFTAPVDLRLAVRFLEHHPHYGMVRYHKLTGHNGLLAVMQEWDTRGIINYDGGENEYVPEMCPYMELLPPFGDSNVFSPYSGGVHLRHRRFTDYYGQYQEGDKFSNTEGLFMERVNAALRTNLNLAQRVAMFPFFVQSRFKDIAGASTYRETDVEAETVK